MNPEHWDKSLLSAIDVKTVDEQEIEGSMEVSVKGRSENESEEVKTGTAGGETVAGFRWSQSD